MLLILAAFAAGLLTIASPCILPVLPIALAREGGGGDKGRILFMAGLAIAFAVTASLAAVAGQWAVQLNQHGRTIGLILLGAFAASVAFPSIANTTSRPFTALARALFGRATGPAGALVVGLASGLVWTPCAGPILGLVLTIAALNGPDVHTGAALLGFGIGSATAISLVVLLGHRVKRSLRWLGGGFSRLRPVLGGVVLAYVGAVGMGLAAGPALPQSAPLTRVERTIAGLVSEHASGGVAWAAAAKSASPLNAISSDPAWLQGASSDRPSLRGKVVLVNFWTYSCINCLRALPYVRDWASRYESDGLVVIGVHTPEFAFEKDPTNVLAAIRSLGLRYPVTTDNDFRIWRAFGNEAWPALYLVDPRGQVRRRSLGEGDYIGMERTIRQLLEENGGSISDEPARPVASGTQAQTDPAAIGSPETYIGFAKAERFTGTPAPVRNRVVRYAAPSILPQNGWTLSGGWDIRAEFGETASRASSISYRFRSRDVHLVLSRTGTTPVRFRVTIDGHPPGADHGTDTDAAGFGAVTDAKLYQLVRQRDPSVQRTVTVHFADPGVRAYAFTFG